MQPQGRKERGTRVLMREKKKRKGGKKGGGGRRVNNGLVKLRESGKGIGGRRN